MKLQRPLSLLACLSLCVPALMGADGSSSGCGQHEDMPDVSGSWAVDYDDSMMVELKIGGSVYTRTLGPEGGVITVEHDGVPLSFDLDCSRADVLCPSEAWPETVKMAQPDRDWEAHVELTLPSQRCDGTLVPADPTRCGAGTRNPDCDDVCEGTVTTTSTKRAGLLSKGGDRLSVLLGAAAASNGVNCLLLGLSVAEADVVSEGGPRSVRWEAVRLEQGHVTTGYAGGCLFAGSSPDALVAGASIKVTTGFEANRL
ncbi:MAG: hypothetical protein H6744_18595 [Deltaproteobacteria bacterium]|nr:hypothetical protein [Deltaproteobacteria bacterium]MCB9788691.1 hypothetical protein [Deltaproteobacteria bacterium]